MNAITSELTLLFSDLRSGITEREDSRAFGAMIEKRITDCWSDICKSANSEFIPKPGQRTIYDFASRYDGKFFGFDVKTKDLDSDKYSDGGVCAVGNLLKFLVNENAAFVVVEFGHSQASENKKLRNLEYVKAVPFHLLPRNAYRIENLGTGQVRLNGSISEIHEDIEWNRSMKCFLDIFVDLAIEHYEKVGKIAQDRINAMKRFRNTGYVDFSF